MYVLAEIHKSTAELLRRTHPTGKIVEKAVWRSAFWTKWHCKLNDDSTKTHSSSVNF